MSTTTEVNGSGTDTYFFNTGNVNSNPQNKLLVHGYIRQCFDSQNTQQRSQKDADFQLMKECPLAIKNLTVVYYNPIELINTPLQNNFEHYYGKYMSDGEIACIVRVLGIYLQSFGIERCKANWDGVYGIAFTIIIKLSDISENKDKFPRIDQTGYECFKLTDHIELTVVNNKHTIELNMLDY